MKTFLILTTLLLTGLSFSQNYSPFNSNVPKRFQNSANSDDNLYYFYPITTDTINDTIAFRQYFQKSTQTISLISNYCQTWGFDFGFTEDTTWLGQKIDFDILNQHLILFNSEQDTLNFDFGLTLGDSSLFYQKNNDNYYLKYVSLSAEMVIDSIQNVKTFTIWKYDDFGNLEVSPLNGFEIKLSQNLGLASFINCSDFPNIETGVTLMGQLHPTIGHYQMTYNEAFPWQSGDELEIRGIHSNSDIEASTYSYKFLTILNRIETIDSVWIYYDSIEQLDYFPPGAPVQAYPTPYNWSYSNPIVFRKDDNVIEEPINMTSAFGRTIDYDSIDYCGMKNRIAFSTEFDHFCDSCNCMIAYDGFMQNIEDRSYMEDLGMFHQEISGWHSDFHTYHADVIYANINEIECGTKVFLGIDELPFSIGVKPNPTNGFVELSSTKKIMSVEVINTLGLSCFSIYPKNLSVKIDLEHLVSGIYYLKVKDENGKVSVVKLVRN